MPMIQNCWNSPVARRVVPLGCFRSLFAKVFTLQTAATTVSCGGMWLEDNGFGWAVGSGWRKSWDPDVNKLLVLAKTLGRGELDSHEHVYTYICIYRMYVLSCVHPRPGISIRRPPHRGWLTMGHSSFGLNIMVGKPAVRCLSSTRMWRYASFHQSSHRFQQLRWGEAGLAFFQENTAKWRMHEDSHV